MVEAKRAGDVPRQEYAAGPALRHAHHSLKNDRYTGAITQIGHEMPRSPVERGTYVMRKFGAPS